MPTRHRQFPVFDLTQHLLLLALALLQTILLASGDSQLYLAPRMMPFLYFSTTAFCILAVHGLWNLFRRPSDGCDCGCAENLSLGSKIVILALFGLVLGTGFILPHQPLDSRVADKKGISLQRHATDPLFGGTRSADDFLTGEHLLIGDIPWDSAQAWEEDNGREVEQERLRDELGIWYDRELYTEMARELLGQDFLEITSETFLDAMLVISAYLEAFAGRSVEFAGFVYHDGTMAENELAVARISITCCLADATVYGLLVRAPSLPLPPNDAWVRVRGRIAQTVLMEESIPVILADDLEIVPAPDQPYVYPRLYNRHVIDTGSN